MQVTDCDMLGLQFGKMGSDNDGGGRSMRNMYIFPSTHPLPFPLFFFYLMTTPLGCNFLVYPIFLCLKSKLVAIL